MSLSIGDLLRAGFVGAGVMMRWWLGIGACCFLWWFAGVSVAADSTTLPMVADPDLRLTLIASDPDIVTPIGLAIDASGRLFVLESHTHEAAADYPGPDSDRIKVFADEDGDGDYESVTIFADGLVQGLTIAFSPAGDLYAVCARSVYRLPDRDGDGRCDGLQRIIDVKTKGRYSHNALLGITFDADGNLFLSRGNLGGQAYRVVGSDGTEVRGYGDGGNIMRSNADGGRLIEYATGFWNPFGIKFDGNGRLLCVDNDPDARGPNRLIHVVRGGDYGYRSLHGGSGTHPYQGWDGDPLSDPPGTLPYISGTGEAPCDLLDLSRTNFPTKYRDSLLVSVWTENTIEWHQMRPKGISVTADVDRLIQGDTDFRPVAFDVGPGGDVFFTDWVQVDYPNHGRGRIWRLSSTRTETDAISPRPMLDSRSSDNAGDRFRQAAESIAESNQGIIDALGTEDPFQNHLGVMQLASPENSALRQKLVASSDPKLRLASLLASRRATLSPDQAMRIVDGFLTDTSPIIRRAALIWAGEDRLVELQDRIEGSIRPANTTPVLMETYLATAEILTSEFSEAFEHRVVKAKQLPKKDVGTLVRRIAWDSSIQPAVRAIAIRRLQPPLTDSTADRLIQTAHSTDHLAAMAAIGVLGKLTNPRSRECLMTVAMDASRSSELRCEALLMLASDPELDPKPLLSLLDDAQPSVAEEAARTLRSFIADPIVRAAAERRLETSLTSPDAVTRHFAMALGRPADDRPEKHDDWLRYASSGGDPAAGRRVFLSNHATCAKCHSLSGRDDTLGPDLSRIALSVDRSQLIRSVLNPSADFAPQYQAWTILTADGQVVTGLQIDQKAGGAIEIMSTDGVMRRIEGDDVEDYQASRRSVMPSGLEQNLTATEFRDLIAFLASRK
ncbi:PVC-type heme-binding CxxCH protein [Crateriforma conspicua]|uniref:PVC-type heme-binding CxxCH protein n=1 Tax=Crateriforma conspicua TaxID=2527996 RepID=UPI00118852ED|nr:PVC-type heme-binding CxxCH protein [Crateriforma conspicua]QDV61295.1 Cytochrome c [Crateriforma conspicua]